jgi:membrane-bound metal-dependent hydrolase YbcI (DUF457 family)
MDTITHGLAGALLGKALFRGDDIFTKRPASRERIVSWAATLGAIFPDSDTFRDIFSRDPLLVITWHRSITHSLLLLPAYAIGLAALTQWFARRRRWECPSFPLLALVYAAGILSHILLDLVNNFGTMIWSPLSWSRPAWDLIFIIDFTFSAILFLPQILAWVYENKEKSARRAARMWVVTFFALLLITALAHAVNAPLSAATVTAATFILLGVFFLPLLRGWGFRISRAAWSRAGLVILAGYFGAVAVAHRTALARVRDFAANEHLEVQSLAALPLPPSLWHWDGLIRTPRGVYELRVDLSNHLTGRLAGASGGTADPNDALEYSYYPDAPDNLRIEEARQLREVRKVFQFTRFPVTRFRMAGGAAIVEIVDLRFRSPLRGGPSPFTYSVRFDAAGHVVSLGWVTR